MNRTFAATMLALCAGAAHAQYSAIPIQPSIDGSSNAVTQSVGLGAGTGNQVGNTKASGIVRAARWQGSLASYVDLHPPGYSGSSAQESDASTQVGNAIVSDRSHAMLWTGTAASFVDLHPASGYDWTVAWGVGGGSQVGFGRATGFHVHALLWTGTAGSVVDLHPAGYRSSWAYGTTATEQVGEGAVFSRPTALKWNGTAASVVNMNPAGYLGSGLRCTDGTTQGGYVIAAGPVRQAGLWSGTAASFVNLHPAFVANSQVWDLAGNFQVGHGKDSLGVLHAIVWKGTAASAIDLNQYLPAGYTDAYAFGVDSNGNVTGHAKDGSGNWVAMYWAPQYTVGSLSPANLNGGTFNSTFHIQFTLTDINGNNVANDIVTTKLERVGPPTVTIPVNDYSNQGNTFTYNTSTFLYKFSVLVNKLSSGLHRLTLTFGNGSTRVFEFNRQ